MNTLSNSCAQFVMNIFNALADDVDTDVGVDVVVVVAV